MFGSKKWLIVPTLAAIAGMALTAGHAKAADYFSGKNIDIIVGGAAGGGIDLYARLVAHHWPDHIPGHPTITVKNAPGAGGTRAAQNVAFGAPANGLTVGALAPGVIIGPLLDDKVKQLDPSKFQYIGTTNVGVSICTTMDKSKTKTFQDALQNKTIMGAQSPGAPSYDIAYLVKNLTGAKFDIVPGYNGSTHITLAMDRGEVDGICGWNWSGARSQKADWLRDKRLNLLAQIGIIDDEDLTKMGVPTIWKFLHDDQSRKIARFILAQKGFERPLLVRQGTPPALVNILRTAFDATMKDPQFRAEAKKTRLEVSPSPGIKVQELVEKFYETPKDIVEKGRAAIRP